METVKIHQIKLDDSSFREEQGNITQLANDIQERGLINPLTINQDGRLLAGRRRLAALIQLGWTDVPVNRMDTTGELGDRLVELSENLMRKNLEWVEEVNLKAEIDHLQKLRHGDQTINHNRQAWSTRKTAALLGESATNTDRDILLSEAMTLIPELKDCTSKAEAQKKFKQIVERQAVHEIKRRGQEENGWSTESSIIGRAEQSYILGDAIAGMRDIPINSFVLAEVDPPYGINLHALRQTEVDSSYHEIDAAVYPAFIKEVALHVYRLLKDDAWCVWWFGMSYYPMVLQTLREVGFDVDEIPCIWTKPTGQTNQPDRRMARAWEGFFLCRKGNPVMHKRGHVNVFTYTGVSSDKRIHPTERPLEMMVDIIGTLCLPGSGKVLIPFLGSGNSIRAAQICGLPAVGWDLCDESIRTRFIARLLEDFKNLSGK